MRDRLTIPYGGFSLYLLVEILSFHSSTAFSGIAGYNAVGESHYLALLISARIGAYLVVAFALLRKTSVPPANLFTVTACTIGSCAGLGLIIASSGFADTPVLTVGALLFGASQGIMGLYWLSSLTTLDYRERYLYILISHAIATALCALILLVPLSGLFPAMALCLLVSNVFLMRMPSSPRSAHSFHSQVQHIVPRLGKAILTVCVFAFASGFMLTISSQATPDADPVFAQYTVLGISGIVLVIMLIPTFAFKRPLEIETGYKVALPLAALGFLILPGFIDIIPPFIAGTLTTTGYMVTGIVLYCGIAEVTRAARIPSLPLYAASEALSLLFLLVGVWTGYAVTATMEKPDVGLTLVGAGSLYLLAICASWLFSRSKNEPAKRLFAKNGKPIQGKCRETTSRTPEHSASDATCSLRSLAQRYGLTEQEQTIFMQLVEGRTLPRIAKDLFLSTGTVKYHTQKIYRAFDVHSRSELLAAVARLQGSPR